jgi:hypothetical protein
MKLMIDTYEVKAGLILQCIYPYSEDSKYYKVLSIKRKKKEWYLTVVRSKCPDIFPEYAAHVGKNGDTGLTVRDMKEFLIAGFSYPLYKR